MTRYECNECGFVWFRENIWEDVFTEFALHSAYWSETEDQFHTCPNCKYLPFAEWRKPWYRQHWRPSAENYWRLNNND